MIPPLTPDQANAAHSPARLLLIEAAPGTGKTRAATERYGVLRYRNRDPSQGLLVLSFTVAATHLLRKRIRDRWGPRALVWPNRASTLDGVFRSILEYLLRSGEVNWPDARTKLQVVESWRGFGGRRLEEPGILWSPVLRGRSIVPAKVSTRAGEHGLFTKRELLKQLAAGRCQHADVRELVCAALVDADLRPLLREYARHIASAVLVDEAFDVSASDIKLMKLFVDAGCDVTLIGDPWQAIYGFRTAAEPKVLRGQLVDVCGFEVTQLATSFRFETTQVRELADRLRCRTSIAELPFVDDPDVVLAASWRLLWNAPINVLPLAFGPVVSGASAAISLALDFFLRKRFGEGARLFDNAAALLRIDVTDYLSRAEDVYGPILTQLSRDGADGAEDALEALCLCPKTALGAPRKPTLRADARPGLTKALRDLAGRLSYHGPFVRGMTVHQAKGQEWARVAVLLAEGDSARLARGLNPDQEEDRRLYVSLTRGRFRSGVLGPP